MSETISQTPYISSITDSDLFLFDSVEQPTGQWTSHCFGSDLSAYIGTRLGLPASYGQNGYAKWTAGVVSYSATIPGNVLTSPLTAALTIPSPILTSPTINTALTLGAGVTLPAANVTGTLSAATVPGSVLTGPLASGLTIPSPTITSPAISGATLTGATTFAPATAPNPQQSRLFLANGDNVPHGTILSFSSANAVADFDGVGTNLTTLATEYFASFSGVQATFLLTRFAEAGARPRVYGANLGSMTLGQLQAINGTISVQTALGTLAGTVNLSGTASFAAGATLIQTALNSALPTIGVYPGSSIAAETASCTAYCTGCVMVVTGSVVGTIYPGAVVSTLSAYDATGVFISNQLSGTTGGTGVYALSVGVGYQASGTFNLTYGILTVGTLTSGSPAEGQMLTGTGVTANSVIARNLSGSGAGSTWIIPYTQTVSSTTISATPVSLNVTNNTVTGADFNTNSFWIVNNSYWPTDTSATIAFPTGTAAAALGFTQASGATICTNGTASPIPATFMNNLVANLTSNFSSFQTTFDLDYYGSSGEATQAAAFAAWAATTGGQFTFLGTPGTATTAGALSLANPRTAAPNSAYTALATDRLVAYGTLTAARVTTLPYSVNFPAGVPLTIIDESGNCSPTKTITANIQSPDTIVGNNVISSAYGSITLESNGAGQWTVISSNNSAAVAGAPYSIGQSHIPFVIPSSGTMGNNGALSAITALSQQYAGAYFYIPAGQISSGQLAGWYWGVPSSTTAVTLYNNTYTSGTPNIPGSPTPFVTTAVGMTQGTGAYIQAYALTIPGNTIGANGTVRVTGLGSYNNSSGVKSIQLQYGGTALGTAAPTTTTNFGIATGFSNRGITNSQVSLSTVNMSSGAIAATLDFGAVDSTSAQTLGLNMKLAGATDTVTLENILVELIPGVT